MNNKKVLYKFSVILGLLLNSGIKSAQADPATQAALAIINELYEENPCMPPQGVEWCQEAQHPLFMLLNNAIKNQEDINDKKGAITKHAKFLNTLSYFFTPDNRSKLYNPPLFEFVKQGVSLEFLLKLGANPRISHYAFIKKTDFSHQPSVGQVYNSSTKSQWKKTEISLLFHLIVLYASVDTIRCALAYGADPNKGYTVTSGGKVEHQGPLFHAITHTADDLAVVLIAWGADVKQVKQELGPIFAKNYETIVKKQKFQEALQEEKERPEWKKSSIGINEELSKQVGVTPGTVAIPRMLQMRKLVTRPGFRVPGVNF